MAANTDIIEDYVAVWNEADPERRRRRIREVWAPGGATCYRLLDARGHDAIEARVRSSWERWLADGSHVFRPERVSVIPGSTPDAIRLDFLLLTVPDATVEANGLCFLLLDERGRVERDYQFNPSADEPNAIVERYLAALNEADPIVRRRLVAELWAPDGALVSAAGVREGLGALLAAAGDAYAAHGARGHLLESAKRTHAHHNVVKFGWRAATGAVATELLVLDSVGRIGADYRFAE